MSNIPMKVLITDAESRKAFDLFNIFKNKYKMEIVLTSRTTQLKKLSLIYGQNVYRLRASDLSLFIGDLNTIFKSSECNDELVYIPVSERYTLMFYDFIKINSNSNLRFLLPDKGVFELTRDKIAFQNFCEENLMPVPLSYNKIKSKEFTAEFCSLIAKPRIGAGSVGIKYFEDITQIKNINLIDQNLYLIQEKIESDKTVHGGFFLCKEGNVVGFHSHKRIRTFPEKGGVSVYAKAENNLEIKAIGSKLLKLLNWNGLAMIEFIYDRKAKSWKIIELNPRLWGSLLLTEFCNSNLLINYINLSLNRNIEEPILKEDSFMVIHI